MPPPLPFIPFGPHMNALRKPMFHRMPYIHILHLRALPPRYHSHSLFGSHQYRIPWNKYRKFRDLMPSSKPKWLPFWIWKQVQRGMHSVDGTEQKQKLAAADMEKEDYYDYNVDLADFYDAMTERENEQNRRDLAAMDLFGFGDEEEMEMMMKRGRSFKRKSKRSKKKRVSK